MEADIASEAGTMQREQLEALEPKELLIQLMMKFDGVSMIGMAKMVADHENALYGKQNPGEKKGIGIFGELHDIRISITSLKAWVRSTLGIVVFVGLLFALTHWTEIQTYIERLWPPAGLH